MRTSRHAHLHLLCCLLSYALLSNTMQFTQSAAAGGAPTSPRVNPSAAYGQSNNGGRNGSGQSYVPPALRHDNDQSRGKDSGGLVVEPPAPPGDPGAGLPNLEEARRVRTSPRTSGPSAPIQPDLPCADCDTGGGGAGGSDPYFGTGRTRPPNRTGGPGVTLGSRNFNWGVTLVSLPGRAGLDLSISLYYNSLVWTRQGNTVQFNADHGTPSPGFQLGLPRLQQKFLDADSLTFAYVMITPSGGRVEMRQTAAAGVYESSDSTFTQLTEGAPPVVRTTDGTQYVFGAQSGAEWRCTQIKDRNGNFISAQYDGNGHVVWIRDTLNRQVNFNYNAATQLLESVTQTWAGATHVYASFYYGSINLWHNFPGLTPVAPAAGSGQTVLASVVMSGSLDSYNFDYNSYGQVHQIRHNAPDARLLAFTRYNISDADINGSAQADCPRFTERRDWARLWNGDWDGAPAATEEAVTAYSVTDGVQFTHPATGATLTGTLAQQTTPDGTTYKEYSLASGWGAGLPQLSEVWSDGARRKYGDNVWTQDNTSLPYQQNPRVIETNVRDLEGNRRRAVIEYNYGYAAFDLPSQVIEYASDGQTPIRRTLTDYRMDSAYVDRRVVGLVSQRTICDGAWNVLARTAYQYDTPWAGYMTSTPAAPTQHDEAGYGAGFLVGRGNVMWEGRFDASDPYNWDKAVTRTFGYNQTGSMTFSADVYVHTTSYDYADSFSDGAARNTYAYTTKVTDPEGYYSTAQFSYDFGGVTRTHTPTSGTGAGVTYLDVTTQYDPFGRVELQTNLSTGAYRRWGYDPAYAYVQVYETIKNTAQADEFHYWQALDGAGRVRATAQDHPGSSTGFSGQYYTFDSMGRVSYTSNTAEIDAYWNPAGDDAGGWRYTSQTYDWKGRPLQTTNPDGTTRVLSYGGCGCAGGEVTTVQDEHGRRKRYTKDALGRLSKTEELNWDGTVYSTTGYAYDALDNLRQLTQQGQTRTLDYDGHGRLWRRTTPEQGTTTYAYNADDTLANVVDARGVKAVFGYNARRMVTSVSYDLSGVVAGQNVQPTASVSYAYDAAGNRTSMTDGMGASAYHYDNLGRMNYEQRTFVTGPNTTAGPYTINYGYNVGGELTSVTNPWGVSVNYSYDRAGRLTSVGGANYAGVTSYADSMTYRAFGALKGMTYREGPSGRPLYTAYDARGRLTKWDASGVLGYRYYYDDFNERTGRVTFAQRLTPSTANLDRAQTSNAEDRSYEYDQVGRLIFSHSGAEAKAHAFTGHWGALDGPYSQGYEYDAWGNMTRRYGWGGEVQGGGAGATSDISYVYANNRRNGYSYDAAGNLTFDGGQHFSYDAAGSQVTSDYTDLRQAYDGDGLRVKKSEYGGANSVCYLRSTVLGGQFVAEVGEDAAGAWQWRRGYVYAGGSLLAVQQGGVYFVHEDPVTKSRRVTDVNGATVSAVELDPYGSDTSHSSGSAFQPRRFTSYERDSNGTDEAMFRRYNRWHSRFDQPDPYDGSYDLTNPQTFNRYAYVSNDPVNFVDPTGLMAKAGGVCTAGDGNPGIVGEDGICYPGAREVVTVNWGVGGVNDGLASLLFGRLALDLLLQSTVPLPSDLKNRVGQRLNKPGSDCADYIARLIAAAEKIDGKAYSTDAMANYDRVQREGGFRLREQKDKGTANFNGNKRVVDIKPVTSSSDPRKIDNVQTNYAGTALNEIIHHAKNSGVYGDRVMSRAAFNIMTPEAQKNNPLPSAGDDEGNARYWHPKLLEHCQP